MRLPVRDSLLDEFVMCPDPMAWHTPKVRNVSLERQHRLVMGLIEEKLLHRVGIARRVWEDGARHTDVLYGPTTTGLEYWNRVIRDRRSPGSKHSRFSVGLRAAAVAPREVFDLPRAPWRHKLTREVD